MKENFGVPNKPKFGRMIVGIHMYSKSDADEMLSVFNAAMRSGVTSPQIEKWRREILNIRSRAYQNDWNGWE